MAESIQLHNDVMRNLLEQYRGYEVKTEGGIYSIFLIILIKYYSFIYYLFLYFLFLFIFLFIILFLFIDKI